MQPRRISLLLAVVSSLAVALLVSVLHHGGAGNVSLLHEAEFTSSRNRWSASMIEGDTPGRRSLREHKQVKHQQAPELPYKYHKGDDVGVMKSEVRHARDKVLQLSKRDVGLERVADSNALEDLKRYNDVFSQGLDHYKQTQQNIDHLSYKTFHRHDVKKPVKPAYDPLQEEERIWNKAGVSGDVLGVPAEYHHSISSNPGDLKDVPDYVKRAYNELGSGAVEAMKENWPKSHQRQHRRVRRSRTRNVRPLSGRASRMSTRQSPEVRQQQPSEQRGTMEPRSAASTAGSVRQVKPSLSKEMVKTVQQVANPLVWAKAVPLTGSPAKHSQEARIVNAPKIEEHRDHQQQVARATQPRSEPRHATENNVNIQMIRNMAKQYEDKHSQVKKSRSSNIAPNLPAAFEPAQDAKGDELKQEISRLHGEIAKLKEQAEIRKLKKQIVQLKVSLVGKLAQEKDDNNSTQVEEESTNSTQVEEESAVDEGSESSEQQEVEQDDQKEVEVEDKDGGKEGDKEEQESKVNEEAHEEASAPGPVRRKVKICDGLGCYSQELPHQTPPAVLSSQQGKDEALRGGGDLGELIFPGKNTWEPEVHLNSKGEIRADHDDPNGHLMPHNKYQAALYPDGQHRQRNAQTSKPGITNSVASQLFEDTIVKAAPGFNAGLGRHTRAQEAEDWERNWETRIYNKKTGETLV